MSDEIINRVANSGLITFNIEDLLPVGDRVFLDIKNQLYQEVMLKEKDFRAFLKEHDWSEFQDKFVAIGCSVDAIIPTWAFMLIGIKLQPFAKRVVYGDLELLENAILNDQIDQIDFSNYEGKRVVIKGCSDKAISEQAYVDVAQRLIPFASSVMFGESCSTVPLFKRPKTV